MRAVTTRSAAPWAGAQITVQHVQPAATLRGRHYAGAQRTLGQGAQGRTQCTSALALAARLAVPLACPALAALVAGVDAADALTPVYCALRDARCAATSARCAASCSVPVSNRAIWGAHCVCYSETVLSQGRAQARRSLGCPRAAGRRGGRNCPHDGVARRAPEQTRPRAHSPADAQGRNSMC